jgi:hypothetical protein
MGFAKTVRKKSLSLIYLFTVFKLFDKKMRSWLRPGWPDWVKFSLQSFLVVWVEKYPTFLGYIFTEKFYIGRNWFWVISFTKTSGRPGWVDRDVDTAALCRTKLHWNVSNWVLQVRPMYMQKIDTFLTDSLTNYVHILCDIPRQSIRNRDQH